MTSTELAKILKKSEGIDLEFKAARNSFRFDDITKYCSAFSNVGGGYLLLGVDDTNKVTGTAAYDGTYHELPEKIYAKCLIEAKVDEVFYDSKRVLVFQFPPHYPGRPVSADDGKYYCRVGSSMVEMSPDKLREVFSEVDSDYTSEYCIGAGFNDLDTDAIKILKNLWARKSNREDILLQDDKRVLSDLRLVDGRNVTRAAIILVGSEAAISKYAPSSEIILEWRQIDNKISYDFRREWRGPLVRVCDEIMREIQNRNMRYDLKEGLFNGDIWSFNIEVVREALINAIAHRDYRLCAHSVWIKFSSSSFNISSPGGLVNGITLENIFERSAWRNRLLSDVLQKVGWMEQSSQGMDTIFQKTIGEGKGTPKLSVSNVLVELNIPAVVIDENFVAFLNLVMNEKRILLSTQEVIELDRIRMEKGVHQPKYKESLVEKGLIASEGRGTATRYFLTKDYYEYIGKIGEYTRMKGLTTKAKRALIEKHLNENKRINANDLAQMFPELSYQQRYNLVRPMISDGILIHIGSKKDGFWSRKK